MIVSNCWSSGADSYANPVTGVVSRKDPVTGQAVPANIRPSGSASADSAVTHAADGASLSSPVLSALLAAQEV